MAFGAHPIARLPGFCAAGLVFLVTVGSLAAVIGRAESAPSLGPADWAAVRFTLLQAVLSAAFSVVLAVPVARALARRQFLGRRLLVTLLGAPFILPVIVATLGLLAIFGRSGVISTVLGWVGLPPVQIYGLQGVVLAHVFLNMPLATRLVLQGWLSIPAEHFRLAASLGFAVSDIGRTLERPMLRSVLPGAFLVIFLICTTSFAVALVLGGGPKGTTVELAIYQAFRFDFDLAKAALLALILVAICGVAAVLVTGVALPTGFGGGLDRSVLRWDARGRGARILDGAYIFFASAFLLLPLGMVVLDGLPGLRGLPVSVLQATVRSILVALSSMVLTLVLALSLALLAQNSRRITSGLVDGLGAMSIAVSPLVIGTGLFIVVFPIADPVALALPITALVNAIMSLPFVYRAVRPALTDIEANYGRLSSSLGLTGFARLRIVIIPRLARPLGFSAGLAAALSMGDLGVVALFADPDQATLPMHLYQLMGAYRMQEAAGAGLVLLTVSLALFWLFDRGGRLNVND
jgi:thiamine transport system permease protein